METGHLMDDELERAQQLSREELLAMLEAGEPAELESPEAGIVVSTHRNVRVTNVRIERQGLTLRG